MDINVRRLLERIEKESSLSNYSMFKYNILFHKRNKLSLSEIEQMTVPAILDYKEALDIVTALEDAAMKDFEFESELNKGK